jgi:transcriptional regulator with XRE-family HTH domain
VTDSPPKITDEQIGRRMRVLRGDRSQRDLASAMKARGWPWSQTTVWQAEAGQRPLKLAEAVDLADELGVHLDQLLGVGGGLAIDSLAEVAAAELAAGGARYAELSSELEAAGERLDRAQKTWETWMQTNAVNAERARQEHFDASGNTVSQTTSFDNRRDVTGAEGAEDAVPEAAQ